METFIDKDSITRRIWSTTDITLFIFAGASAEFALNKQVGWLYFTGKLPADPIGRLFSTIQYSQKIIFSDPSQAEGAIQKINSIHHQVESARGRRIPEHAYKDVLYLLIYYSIAAFELLERKLTEGEKDEIVESFAKIGIGMGMHDLPWNYDDWKIIYAAYLDEHLENSVHTQDLYRQYHRHLGRFRYFILLEIQRLLVSDKVNQHLHLGRPVIAHRFVAIYRSIRKMRLGALLIQIMVPAKFRNQVKAMEAVNARQSRSSQLREKPSHASVVAH